MKERGLLLVVVALLLITFLATGLSPTGYVVQETKDPFAQTSCSQDVVLINQIIPCERGQLQWDASIPLHIFS